MSTKQQLRRALHTAGLEPRAVALKRAFEPAHTTQDRTRELPGAPLIGVVHFDLLVYTSGGTV